MTWPTLRARRSCASGGKARKASTLPSTKSSAGFLQADDPFDVALRIEPDIGRHGADEDVRVRRQIVAHADLAALEIRDASDVLATEQLVAADMHAGDHLDRRARIEGNDESRREIDGEVDLATRQHLGLGQSGLRGYEAEIRKPLCPDQVLGDVLRSNADAGPGRKAGGRGFERRVLRRRDARRLARLAAAKADAPARKRRRFCDDLHGGASFSMLGVAQRDRVTSSTRASVRSRKRQSVPSAMIRCGVDLIMPVSCMRSAKKRMEASAS